MELAAIWKQLTGRSQDIKVNVRNAVCNLAAIFDARHNGITIPFRQRTCAVLGCQATRDEFIDRCVWWNAKLLEEAMNAVGASCAMVRTREECFHS